MIGIAFITEGGERHTVSARAGANLQEVAIANDIPGILGECGGSCSCATCHIHVEESWLARLDAPQEQEMALLDFVEHRCANSRLACQIIASEALDGLVVRIPPEA